MKRIFILFFAIICLYGNAQKNKYHIHTLAFYNLENLFDTLNDPSTNDEASPLWKIKQSRGKIYHQKIANLAKVIREIGTKKTNAVPSILGIAEIENEHVIYDLIHAESLQNLPLDYIHYNSPDKRGIDVGLIYNQEKFFPISHRPYELRYWSATGHRLYTRDQLLVSGYLENELIHIIVNHWPSRRGGEKKSKPYREKAALLNKKICDSILKDNPQAKIILMGDLNDNPTDDSLKKILQTETDRTKLRDTVLFNPFEILFKNGIGSMVYRDKLHLFDQIILNGNFHTKDIESLQFYKSHVFNPPYLTIQEGKYKGYPFRSFGNSGFTGGYSDHYPVYIYLIKKQRE